MQELGFQLTTSLLPTCYANGKTYSSFVVVHREIAHQPCVGIVFIRC